MIDRALKIGIHPDRTGQESYSDKWAEEITRLGHQPCLINLLSEKSFSSIDQFDGFMWRWIHNPQDKQSAKRILYAIEKYHHIPVFPNHNTAWHYDEKISQYYLLKSLNAPIPNTWIFWSCQEAMDWIHSDARFPVVFKLSSGAASANVIYINNAAEAEILIRKMFGPGMFPYSVNEFRNRLAPQKSIESYIKHMKAGILYGLKGIYPPLPEYWWKPEHGYAYFQEFLPGNDFDTRVTIIGNRGFAFRRRNRQGDFRASGSGLIDYAVEEIDKRCLQIAFDISKRAGFQSMAYDFLEKDGQQVVVEISYTFADSAVANCPGYWTPEMEWVPVSMYPERAQVEDFIQYILDRSGHS
ncbi:MAG: hypothetical protein GX491_03835 [Chloroflexi bacterium]|nr:hypothetical protein [Chloroflexota bacterium]